MMPNDKTLLSFIENFQSAVIGTIDENGLPFSSYAPFVHNHHRYYIFISDIATHADNIKRTKTASLFFIEDESRSSNIFARKRISLQCEAAPIPRKESVFAVVMNEFGKKFDSSMIDMLMSMSDFNLYELKTIAGEATFGFADAYRIAGEEMETLVPRQGGGGHNN